MGELFTQLLLHLFGRLLPPDVQILAILGWAVALGLWCLHYAVRGMRGQRLLSVALIVMAATIVVPLCVLPSWSARQLLWLCACGVVEYAPLAAWTERTQFRSVMGGFRSTRPIR